MKLREGWIGIDQQSNTDQSHLTRWAAGHKTKEQRVESSTKYISKLDAGWW